MIKPLCLGLGGQECSRHNPHRVLGLHQCFPFGPCGIATQVHRHQWSSSKSSAGSDIIHLQEER